MSGEFTANYNVGGDIDRVKNLKNVDNIVNMDNVNNVNVVASVDEIKRIKGFPSKTRPYNVGHKFSVPAQEGDFVFDIPMLDVDYEILSLCVTCSGYGEDDSWDLYYNDEKWFDHWYTSEVKEGLFLGTSTYVFCAEANSKFKLIFHNTGQQKTIYFGVRTLI